MDTLTIENERALAEMRKLNEEGAKLLTEQRKLDSKTLLNGKKQSGMSSQ